jgi:16S rRNA (adenine1518-N6/adenine1519-N6)-dimethyltransferase
VSAPNVPHLEARELLAKYNLRAKKSWGQNFLVEERVFRAIVEATIVDEGDWAVEIGAGLGTLTARLLERAAHVVAVERDRDMAAILRAELGGVRHFTLAEANALTFDYVACAGSRDRVPAVVGNLPYQIASPILFRLLDARAHLARIVVMLQKEMVDRIVARPDSEAYGALSVMVQMAGRAERICRAPAGAFVPAPRVESAVARVTPFPNGATRVPVSDEKLFSEVVHAAFNQRRKTLRNSLRAVGDDTLVTTALERAGIDPQRRGETLSVEDFARLTDAIHAERSHA